MSNKLKIVRYILTGIIVITMAIFVGMGYKLAAEKQYGSGDTALSNLKELQDGTEAVGGTLTFPYNYVHNAYNKPVYCLSRNADNWDAYKNEAKFTITGYVEIKGSTAVGRGINSTEKVTVTDWSNAFIAYILGCNDVSDSGYKTPGTNRYKQNSIWANINTWSQNVGKQMGIEVYYGGNYGATDQNMLNNANNYALSTPSSSVASNVGGTVEATKIGAPIGPFSFSFSGSMQQIKGYDKQGKELTGLKIYSDSEGNNEITDLSTIKSGDNFWIKEETNKLAKITADEKTLIYNAKIWFLEADTTRGYLQRYMYAVPDSEETTISCDVEVKIPYIELTINKVDSQTGNGLDGVEFILRHNNKIASEVELEDNFYTVKEWVDRNSVNSEGIEEIPESAYRFKTDANGQIKIRVAKDGNDLYSLQEITPKDGYAKRLELSSYTGISKNENYDFISGSGDQLFFNLDADASAEIKLTNKKIVSVKGYVWLEEPQGKDESTDNNGAYDGIYTEGQETLIDGVKVYLKLKDGETPSEGFKAQYETVTQNGGYTFEECIYYEDLGKYYVEFDYSDYQNQKGKKYIPVIFNSTDPSKIVPQGSRALYDEIPTEDYSDKYNGIVSTYKQKDTEKEKVYGLSGNLCSNDQGTGLYNESANTIEYINLGIKALIEPDYQVKETIEYVELEVRGYKYTYYVNADGINKEQIKEPSLMPIKLQDAKEIDAYVQTIYPSDISYYVQNAKTGLELTVVYRIDITNLKQTHIQELYMEKALHIESLINNYDTNRYILDDENWNDENGSGTATIKKEYLDKVVNRNGEGIPEYDSENPSVNTATAEIKFKATEKAKTDILANPNGIAEEFPTKATAIGYHTYTRKDYSWNNDIEKVQEHRTSNATRSDDAPYLIFKLGKERILSGTVFEDKVVTNNGQKLGNGEYEDSENVVGGVKVDLLDANGKDISTLYGVQKDEATGEYKKNTSYNNQATTYTSKDGKFELVGIVPGDYYLRFTYGDGTQKIYDVEGNEITTVSTENYKSTIVTSEIAKKALTDTTTPDTKWTWYKNLDKDNYNVAVDNLENDNFKLGDAIDAKTAKVSITIENAGEGVTEKDLVITDQDGKKIAQTPQEFNVFKGLNFGVIEKAKQSTELEKLVTNIKMYNAQNSVIFEGNPATVRAQGVSDLDGKHKDGSIYTRIEVKEDELYGSTLVLTYLIKTTNTSDVDYYNKEYYYFGEANPNCEVTLTLEKAYDYMDPKLSISGDLPQGVTKLTDKLEITDKDPLYTIKNTARTKQVKTSSETVIKAQRTLSSEDDDLEFINKVEIVSLRNTTDPDDPNQEDAIKQIKYKSEPELPETAIATVTVTPPTGQDKQTIIVYLATIIATLAILAGGVIVIKKKIL